MRHVKRAHTTAPPSLTTPKGAGVKDIERFKLHRAKPQPKKAFTFRAYKGEDVRHALEALFHGKCAYCESRYDVTGPVDVEHFRPKGAAKDGTHGGYWWLAATWDNLLPSCIDCNRRRGQLTPIARASLSMLLADQKARGPVSLLMTGKESCFPVRGTRMTDEPAAGDADAALMAEDAFLLDPCASEDPAKHIVFHIDRTEHVGLVYARGEGGAGPHLPAGSDDPAVVERAAAAAGVSIRGAVSIQVFGLNRLKLVQERTRVLRQLEFMASLIVDLSGTADRLAAVAVDAVDAATRDEAVERLQATVDRLLAQIRAMADPSAPFSTMAAAWITQFTAGP